MLVHLAVLPLPTKKTNAKAKAVLAGGLVVRSLSMPTGSHLGTAIASTTGLEPYGKWLFKTGIDEKCTEIKMAKLDW